MNRFNLACAALLAASCGLVAPTQAATLWGVTGDGASASSSLFTIDTNTAATTLQTALGNGTDGEGIAYNPNDGLLYHTSGIGSGQQFFETVDPGTLVVGPNLSGGTYGPASAQELSAIEWYAPLGVFIAQDRDRNVYHVTATGSFSLVGNSGINQYARGFAVVGASVFGISPNGSSQNLFEIDPSNGAILNTIPLFLDGQPTTGNGLATDPDTGIVYGVLKDPNNGSNRILATVDVTTGLSTSIGSLGDKFAGITFVPTPSSIALFAMSGFAVSRRRRA